MTLGFQMTEDEKVVITSMLNDRFLLVSHFLSFFFFWIVSIKISTPLGCSKG